MEEQETEQMAVPTAGDDAVQEPVVEAPQAGGVTDDELADSLSAMLAEAEQRGYLRARNEMAQALMKKPRLWENPRRKEAEQAVVPEVKGDESPSLASDFLARVRPSVWD